MHQTYLCLCRFAEERDDDLVMESSFAQQQFEEQRRFVHYSFVYLCSTCSLEVERGFILLLKIWEHMVPALFPCGAGESLEARLRWSHLIVCVSCDG